MSDALKPLIIQGDRSILLDVHTPEAQEARFSLIPFAELEKSPEHLHTYRLTPLSLWNAASAGFSAEQIMQTLIRFSRFTVPESILAWMKETISRYGKIRLLPTETSDTTEYLRLEAETEMIYKEIAASKSIAKFLTPDPSKKRSFILPVLHRGSVKQALLKQGWPVQDEVPLRDGAPLAIALKEKTSKNEALILRDYQKEAASSFVGDKSAGTGFGTIVLPCGAGKTVVGMLVMSMLQTDTLILTTNVAALYQWKRELLDKTDISENTIGLYSGETKEIRPVTLATYQILTWRKTTDSPFEHFELFRKRDWGLIIYDEVHLLPAPVFRITAELQIIRRLGLTATLIREDGCEGDVFSLVGPKRYDVPWKELEEAGWIAHAYCIEVRIALDSKKEIDYAIASQREKYRIASENPRKLPIIIKLLEKHADAQILIIGQYIAQLTEIATEIQAPVITGKMTNAEREILYNDFRMGKIKVLVVSKVANFAIDLPDASVAIQISGSFGSRQEEAQRLGRILRPKEESSYFYTLVTRQSVEEEFAEHRQKFLAEQGYEYSILTEDEIE
ncbi:helicase C-terminal domain protein [Treponema phagedenis F0421]|uniref:DNA repair helicase XPB n=1 Tax=Treponema phagedenis TaxID=162 RepID=UPI0001F63892|nr:DNA repair helicase XPB [Treponema phagedenis]EFW36643.1 helicase C-terminal domain protein [Treponema phagedenis F0421]